MARGIPERLRGGGRFRGSGFLKRSTPLFRRHVESQKIFGATNGFLFGSNPVDVYSWKDKDSDLDFVQNMLISG